MLGELADERAHLAEIEALDPAGAVAEARFERDLEIHNVRRAIFDADVAADLGAAVVRARHVGDGLFLLFARDHAPLPERLDAITGRLEAVATYLEEAKTRATVPQVRRWQQIEIETAGELPAFFDEIVAAGDGVLPRGRAAPPGARQRVGQGRGRAVHGLARGHARRTAPTTGRSAASATTSWSRCARSTGSTPTPSSSSAGSGSHEEAAARAAAAREIDPDADEATVIDRVKARPAGRRSRRPSTPIATRCSARARHLIEHDLVTVPDDERIDVIATPEYLRNVIPFAAYFEPATFDADPKGIYIVTPSVDGDPNAMLEHNFASISNTSIHEAYPGHHLQLDTARRNPSLTRLLTDAPEFVEGWGMYSELMMREHGFDDGPAFRVVMHTDAIWRACRIILDVRMHRGELTVDEATDFLVEQTSFERPNAAAEVQLVHLPPDLPAVVPARPDPAARLRADEQRRLGDAFSLKALPRHAAAERLAADLVPSPAAGRRGPDRRAGHPGHRPRGRPVADRVLAGRRGRASARRPTGPSGSPSGSWRWARGSIHLVDFDGARAGRAGQPRGGRRGRGAGRPSRSSWPAASTRPRRSSWRSRPARRGSC